MSESVPFTDIAMDDAMVERVEAVLRSGRHVKGPECETFEANFAAACETDHAVGVSNGTAALLLAMKVLDIGPGDEVFVPAHTYFATVSPILELGATPRFVDIDPERYTMDPDALRDAAAASESPAAIAVTHMHGQPAAMDELLAIADRHDLRVIEDAAQAHLATVDGRPVGSLGDIGCFSFYPTKNMTVGGDGGMVTTDDETLADHIRALRNHGRDESGEHVSLGLNYRLDETNAAVGDEQLARLPSWIDGRREAAAAYDDRLNACSAVVTPATVEGATHVYHHYPVQVPAGEREAFRAFLDERGVSTGVHYDRTVQAQPAVRERVDASETPVAAEYCARTVSLPMHPRLSDDDIATVCDAVEAFAEGER
ncbi:DegT/DnrJ/EryC1/StrS family aminotransferase [Halosegnis rubeus]|uniref:Aminotransferase class I/II-fold pyridoxal phosphate-dependent enzyme n=1 Tax=Halosegnis rubeus TaxID=2212850 RepID=A0A5N5UH53_9EURY|nr:DegT/DnrJ/EryC1/StrS family aminotransferase [Halosegnis rubeus]KAB7518008.1 aminotransferase class I/II-fold pyridoxal phosphate-dependent enzyme [Halosegnis rubeus]